MLIRLVGGPRDGETFDSVDDREYISIRDPEGYPSPLFPIPITIYRAIRGWAPDGARYFVAPGVRGSLICAAEIEAAVDWMAKQQPADLRNRKTECYLHEMNRILAAGKTHDPDAALGLCDQVEMKTVSVTIRPGLVLGRIQPLGGLPGEPIVVYSTQISRRPGSP